MKLIKCYKGKEKEVEYSDAIGERLLKNAPYNAKSTNASFKTVDGKKLGLKVGEPAVIEKIEVETTFSPEKAREVLETKSYKDLKEIHLLEFGEKAPANIKKTELIEKLIEKANG